MNINKKGFTLIELITVMVIAAIIAAVLVPSLAGYMKNSQKKNCKHEVEMLMDDVKTDLTAKRYNDQAEINKQIIRSCLNYSEGTMVNANIVPKNSDGSTGAPVAKTLTIDTLNSASDLQKTLDGYSITCKNVCTNNGDVKVSWKIKNIAGDINLSDLKVSCLRDKNTEEDKSTYNLAIKTDNTVNHSGIISINDYLNKSMESTAQTLADAVAKKISQGGEAYKAVLGVVGSDSTNGIKSSVTLKQESQVTPNETITYVSFDDSNNLKQMIVLNSYYVTGDDRGYLEYFNGTSVEKLSVNNSYIYLFTVIDYNSTTKAATISKVYNKNDAENDDTNEIKQISGKLLYKNQRTSYPQNDDWWGNIKDMKRIESDGSDNQKLIDKDNGIKSAYLSFNMTNFDSQSYNRNNSDFIKTDNI